MKTPYFFVLFALLTVPVYAQSTMESVLASIEANNKTLQAGKRYMEAMRLEHRTRLNPNNPIVDVEYLRGSPGLAGDQTDITLIQSIDFPTVYGKRRSVANQKIEQNEIEWNATRQRILTQAKLVCIELIYRNKLGLELRTRLDAAQKGLAGQNRLMEAGDGTILDQMKARLHLIQIQTKVAENESTIFELNQKLSEFNGGVPIFFTEVLYPSLPEVPDVETLNAEINAKDPRRNGLVMSVEISRMETDLQKSMSLPSFEVGYRYQGFLGQDFHGVQFGMTIPLWENRNKVQSRQAHTSLRVSELDEYLNRLSTEITSKYTKQEQLRHRLSEYEALFATMNHGDLLAKALSLGEISVIDYYKELISVYEAKDALLSTERDYHITIAELFSHKL
jgi:hypothetical protein